MNVITTDLPEVLLLEPKIFGDDRGFFFESYNKNSFNEATGLNIEFVQDNHSSSVRNVLRGLHYQIEHAQGKLVRCLSGELLDVAVDIRRSSKNFGKWTAFRLSAENKRIAWVPAGFAHGFATLSDRAEMHYKTTDFYHPEHERSIIWNDPTINIDWEISGAPILSPKDAEGTAFMDAEVFD